MATRRRYLAALAGATVLATALLTLSNGKYSSPLAAWLAPPLLVRLLRDLPRGRGLLAGYIACWIACAIQWSGVFPLTGSLFYAASGLLCLLFFVPYLADRLLAPGLQGLRGTWTLPTTMVIAEFLFARFGHFGVWGSLAYSQASVLPLAQVAAVTGTYGVTFLIGWTASLANLVVEDRREGRALPALAVGLWAGVFAAVLGCGLARVSPPRSGAPTMRVAMISPRTDDNANFRIHNAPVTQDSLFARSSRAARDGATLVVWPECASAIFASDEAGWIERAGRFASRERVFLAAPYAARVSDGDPRYENKMVLIDPNGELLWKYRKSRPVPGMEGLVIPGDGRVAMFATPELRLAGMICFDADHPDLMRQLGGHADLLLLPSEDWKEISDLHLAMARLGAIEYGVPIVRSTLHGRSAAIDPFGRVLGSRSDEGPGDHVLLVDIVPGEVPTLYRRVHDLFVALCAIAFVTLLAAALARRRGRRPPE
ncbi:MAG: nitrilase-related carbon-nitrogen hydrolase [bacterium]